MSSLTEKTPPTLAASLERKIALEILRGERVPGSRLPPVRALAAELEVTVPTIQRVIDRLEATGLVSVRRGSGVTVNDPHACAELSLLPMWFEALSDQPKRLGTILADFLELRRVMAIQLIRTRAAEIGKATALLVRYAGTMGEASDPHEIAETDLAFTAAIIDASGHFAAKALFHTTESLVREVPGVAEALYGDANYYRRVIAKVIGALGKGHDLVESSRAVDRILKAWDRRTVSRFQELLLDAR